MKISLRSLLAFVLSSLGTYVQAQNPAYVDFDAYEKLVTEVKAHRKSHLISTQEFITMRTQEKVIILDTRSDSMFAIAHIKGAVHLNFADFTQARLQQIIPSSDYKILIYCNNNFNITDVNAAVVKAADFKRAMATKSYSPPGKLMAPLPTVNENITLALNIPTYINLYGYGYKNVYELSELVNTYDGIIEFEGTAVK